MKHTAGKWKVERFVKVYAGEPHQPIMIVSNGEDIIADVHDKQFAALIAAAPELLDCLRETVQSCHDLLEYARESLADHLLRYGETINKNKLRAEAIQADIASAEVFIRKGEAALEAAERKAK
uniref:Uncharacterized protein n=1 Tax=viral metagenome TaxID=1070528 RepID=A0A6M3KPX0_9ZZZZ